MQLIMQKLGLFLFLIILKLNNTRKGKETREEREPERGFRRLLPVEDKKMKT
ncbi:hypothetical protein V6Z11_A05G388300 [Gossypium hirsutum]